MSPNNGTLFHGVLGPRLLNDPFASFSFINLDFLLLHTAHFDDNIDQPFFVFFFHFYHFNFYSLYLFCTLNNMQTCFI